MSAFEQPRPPEEERSARPPGAAEAAVARLCGTGYPPLRNVRCECHGGTLTLRGRLPTYYLKQISLAAVLGIEGVERVVDEIEVCGPTLSGA